MRINSNNMALNAHRQLGINNNNVVQNNERLSSGRRVNRAADDAAIVSISSRMQAQIRGTNTASRNIQDAISLVQTAEGGMQNIQDSLQRMRELAVQSANGTNQNMDRRVIDSEVGQLIENVDQVAQTTEYNTMQLLDGSYADGLTIQAGANHGDTMEISINPMTSEALGLAGEAANEAFGAVDGQGADRVNVLSQENASTAINTVDNALNDVSMQRAELGAMQNRLEFRAQNLAIQAENAASAQSRMVDADMAQEMTSQTANNLRNQISTAILAQANAAPQGVLRLMTN
ncbi:MAG: flagellin [Oscillospiraceae bacterium]|nr:flagellin [Oscillospiraceae bacterium]